MTSFDYSITDIVMANDLFLLHAMIFIAHNWTYMVAICSHADCNNSSTREDNRTYMLDDVYARLPLRKCNEREIADWSEIK